MSRFIGILLFVSIAVGPSSWGQTLVLKKEADVQGNNLILADLVSSARGLDPKWLKLRVGSTPPIGKERKWSREMLNKKLQKQYSGTLIWDGAYACIVKRPGKWIQEEMLLSMIKASLEQMTAGKGKVEVYEIQGFESFAIPAGPSEAIVDLTSTVLSTPWGTAIVRFEEGGENVMTKSLKFRWSWIREAWKATVNQVKGTSLSENLFEKVEVDVLKDSNPIYFGRTLPDEMELTRGLGMGQVLRSDYFQPQVMIKRGMNVTVHYIQSGVEVTVRAVAMSDGARNEIIPVRNASSRKQFPARVIDERNVAYVN